MKSSRLRWVTSRAAALVALSFAHVSLSESMPHYDLTGLALESEAVVVASRLSARSAGPHQRFETFRVDRVLAGSLRVGAVIEVDTSFYMMNTLPTGARLDPAAALFLAPNRTDPQHPWSIVMSGLRVSASGLAYSFVQRSNPGLYESAPQGPDVRPSIALPAATASPWADCVSAAERAITRASRIRVLTNNPANASRAELVALLGPRPSPVSIVLRDPAWIGLYRDVASERIARIFEARRDVEGALEAGFRFADGPFDYRPASPLTNADLWPTIESAAALPELRATAIRAVTAFTLLDVPLATRLAALLSATEPLVRQAAADVLDRGRGGFSSEPGDERRRRAVNAIVDRALGEYVRREADPLVRFWLIERSSSTPNALGPNVPTEAVFAHAAQRRLAIALGARSANALPAVRRVELELRPRTGAPIACGAQTATWSSSSGLTARWSADLRCAGATDGADYTARFTLALEHRGATRTHTVEQSLRW